VKDAAAELVYSVELGSAERTAEAKALLGIWHAPFFSIFRFFHIKLIRFEGTLRQSNNLFPCVLAGGWTSTSVLHGIT